MTRDNDLAGNTLLHSQPAKEEWMPRERLSMRKIKELLRLKFESDLSIRQIHEKIARRASRGRVGEIVKRVRSTPSAL